MDYNSSRKKLVLPEYGRHIQQMVNHAVTIEDREERMRCAKTIIGIMGTMFPHLRDVHDFKHKLWDHLAIMADFKLDIDYPYEVPEPAMFQTKPAKVPYQNSRIRYMHYGRIVQELIEKAISHSDENEKKVLIQLIAGHMKKSLMTYNKDSATDERVIDDLKLLSNGKLILESGVRLPEVKDVPQSNASFGAQQYRNRKRRPQKK
ncbi:MAG: DUF4290 domain-containing protein [Breznakibacter sp.]